MNYADIPLVDCRDGSEGELLLFALDRVHREFAWKTGGLDAVQLHQRHPPSKLTLAWLIKHLTGVEADWTARAEGRTHEASLRDIDWDAVSSDPDQLYALWYRTIDRTRRSWADMIKNDGLDVVIRWGSDDYRVSRRRALVDILEECLLHTGHASMVREAIDGLVGNGPPD